MFGGADYYFGYRYAMLKEEKPTPARGNRLLALLFFFLFNSFFLHYLRLQLLSSKWIATLQTDSEPC